MATDNSPASIDPAVAEELGTAFDALDPSRFTPIIAELTNAGSYYPASTEWQGYAQSTKLIRLDVAVMALHIAAARVYFKPLPHLVAANIERTIDNVAEIGVTALTYVAIQGSIAWLGAVIRIGIDLINIWTSENNFRLIERSIRSNVDRTMRDLTSDYMSQVKAKNHRRKVLTRHASPKQRRANGSGN